MDPFGARVSLGAGLPDLYRVSVLGGAVGSETLPVTVRILLENLLRHAGGGMVEPADVETLASWRPGVAAEAEIPFMPSRVIMQDLTGVPAVVDLAVMRDAMADLGGDPSRVNPLVAADLVIDHSVQVDRFGTSDAFGFNVGREYDRNGERYQLLRWAQTAFRNLRIVPPGTGIVHQVNLEFLAPVVGERDGVAFPDTLVGTDSHTTMINALGVLGYGVGGIEAEAVLLGQPLYQPMPHVVGVRLAGELPKGSTATDLVLVVTEMLRRHGVVGAFVEFAGDGLAGLSLADRATISNMSPEFGATATLFPIDDETISYLRLTGRSPERIELVERYAKEQGLWREPGEGPAFDELLTLDLGSVEPSVAGPRRPQDRVPLGSLRENFRSNYPDGLLEARDRNGREAGQRRRRDRIVGGVIPGVGPAVVHRRRRPRSRTSCRPSRSPTSRDRGRAADRRDYRPVEVTRRRRDRDPAARGSVAIAAITSCTNTSNPTVMVGAGLLARNAVARGLRVGPTVKTSLAPGSRAVTGYLESAGLMAPLAELGFALAGYGCTTCIGNSGPLDAPVADAVEANDLVVAAVLSGNRNFEGRIHPLARASYLASPPLVVAFALAGRVDIDLTTEPLGVGSDGSPVHPRRHLAVARRDPRGHRRIDRPRAVPPDVRGRVRGRRALARAADPRGRSIRLGSGLDLRREAAVLRGSVVRRPRGRGHRRRPGTGRARRLGHDRPHLAGGLDPAVVARRPVAPGTRRRPARVQLVWRAARPPRGDDAGHVRQHPAAQPPGRWQGRAVHDPPAVGRRDVHLRRRDAVRGRGRAARRPGGPRVRLRIVARLGRQGHRHSSGVAAVIAESYERIHRSNLVGMGVLPLQYKPGDSAASLGLTGRETFSVLGLADGLSPRQSVTVVAVRATRLPAGMAARSGSRRSPDSTGPIEVDYYRGGGILPAVLRRLATEA